MTQAVNLANFANSLNSSGQLDPSNFSSAVPITKGGTNATTASAARTNLGLAIGTDIPSPTGTGASGTWGINISGNAATATSATTAITASNGGVTSVNGNTGAVTVSLPVGAGQVSEGGTFVVQTGASGKCLISLHPHVTAVLANFGTRTVGISIAGTVVASGTLSTMEYDARVSGDGRTITYLYSGTANSNITVTYSVTGSGGTVNPAFYSYIGT